MNLIIALIAGIGFGIGLTISGMVDPLIVLAFLDVAGAWDPSLAFVMGGALAVFIPGYMLLKAKLSKPIFASNFSLPTRADIDKPLLIGAVMFGLGWGISGICPGPAITNVSGMDEKILGFIIAMLVGMIAANKVKTT